MNSSQLLPNLFRDQYGKIVSVLCRSYGLQNLEIAEDLVSETFLLASETWGLKGLPDNPSAWLYAVAANKTKDYLKHKKIFLTKVSPTLARASANEESELDLSHEHISDSQLGMIFAICNPAIPVESQIGLALRILCGFGIDEIAHAFLTTKEVINKRLFRAKEKLRSLSLDIEVPERSEIKARLEPVLTTIYLLFNEGYYSHTRDQSVQNEL
jgi:RNA polymerase sigma factor (sigma-70 family)